MRQLLLDTNALIALSDANHAVFRAAEAALRKGGEASTCSVAWHEYVRGPLLDKDRSRVLRVIESRILNLDRRHAETAAKLFNTTGRRRGSTADCLIAAVAIDSNLEMVTCNTGDFELFIPHGLRLFDLSM